MSTAQYARVHERVRLERKLYRTVQLARKRTLEKCTTPEVHLMGSGGVSSEETLPALYMRNREERKQAAKTKSTSKKYVKADKEKGSKNEHVVDCKLQNGLI